ncbi:MAG: L-threonylcarbamoyladenylate synthase [Chloroflexota bacterium]
MAQNRQIGLESLIERGIATLKSGGLVAYPTDTVYGLGASMLIPEAVRRIFEVKRRPRNMALPLLLANVSQIDEVAVSIPPLARFLAEKFLPGALTLVLYKAESVSDVITAGSPKVAVRVPDHPVPLALISGLGAPITGTSANLSGQPSPLTAGEAASQLGGTVDLIIDGGRVPGGIESTVVDVTEKVPLILRAGAISKKRLEQACASAGLKVKFTLRKS